MTTTGSIAVEMSSTTSLNPAMHGQSFAQDGVRQKNEPQTPKPELTQQEKQEVAELKRTDSQVRAHEAAHMAAGSGIVTGGATFQYQPGPDGKRYAVGGEVSINASPVEGDPEASIRKAEQIRSAALAPADPSSQDRQVAAEASRMAAEARIELAREQQNPDRESEENGRTNTSNLENYRAIQEDDVRQGRSIDLTA